MSPPPSEDAGSKSPTSAGRGRNGGHIVAEVLERHGVRALFGQDSPEWLYEALDPQRLRPITMRDERSAGFAADAVARLTGVPGVACGIHGPGALNLTTALLEAQAACSPLVALISGVETSAYGSGAFQEADHVAIARPLVKHAVRVERPDRLERTVDDALRIAVAGRPGPVLVELPNDVMAAPQPEPVDAAPAVVPRLPGVVPAATDLELAVEVLAGAQRPVVLAGNGARLAHAKSAVERLSERLGSPVVVTAMGRGAVAETSPLFAGVAGFMSYREDGSGWVANDVLARADVVLVLGSALDGATTDGGRLPSPDATVLRVDIDPERLALAPHGQVLIQGDAGATAAALADALGDVAREPWASLAGAWAEVESAQVERTRDARAPLAPARLFGELRDRLDHRDLVVCDAAYSSVWPLSYLRQGRSFDQIVYGRAAGTLGYGLPAAIGASVAYPGRRVVALVGDGGLGFGWGELETLAREGLRVVCIVLNNGTFAYQRLWHDMNDGVSRGLDFVEVRHDRLAQAVGLAGHLVEVPDDLPAALDECLASDASSVIDVRTDPNELPPFNPLRHVG